MKRLAGKLIVIDGSDGSGKATQSALLVETLQKNGHRVEKLDFPQYTDNLIGKLIGECIAGEHGDFLHIDPYIASVLYAADRFEARGKLEKWLSVGRIVVLDRYVSANQIHQGGKISNPKKRSEFLSWLEKLEYGVFGLPKPHQTVYLRMPTSISMELLAQKRLRDKKTYLKKGKKDTVENDRTYLEQAHKSAAWLMKKNVGWTMIECAPRGILRTRESIQEEIEHAIRKTISSL